MSQTYRMTTSNPAPITTPDKVDTRIGTLALLPSTPAAHTWMAQTATNPTCRPGEILRTA